MMLEDQRRAVAVAEPRGAQRNTAREYALNMMKRGRQVGLMVAGDSAQHATTRFDGSVHDRSCAKTYVIFYVVETKPRRQLRCQRET